MTLKFIPRVLIVCCTFAICSLSALAQTSDLRLLQIKHTSQIGDPAYAVGDDPIIVSEAEIASASLGEELRPSKGLPTAITFRLAKFQPLLSAAIDQRLGSPYHWGSTGPNRFDCSGFVWSTFRSAGIDFERSSARSLWSRFEAPAPDEQLKFGTLVFFNRLSHVGIVADENGFYHASRHHGVVYALFAGYWGKHIDGFRRVPLPASQPQHTDESN